MEIKQHKQALRKQYLEWRSKLSTTQIIVANRAIQSQLLTILSQYPTATLLAYSAIPTKNEVDILEALLEQKHTNLHIALPRITSMKESTMEAYIIKDTSELIVNNWGIAEPPTDATICQPTKIDIVIVPLLTFDIHGFRLGYGKGMYDRFLFRCRKDVIKLGISYFDVHNDSLPIDEFDIPLNMCITPEKIYRF
jgi:5-formyltetrahydrofolate cyclo-ligase